MNEALDADVSCVEVSLEHAQLMCLEVIPYVEYDASFWPVCTGLQVLQLLEHVLQ